MGGGFFLALLVAYLVRNHVVAPVSELSRLLQDVANNLDFTRCHIHDVDDEIGTASQAFNRLMDETRSALHEISENTTRVAGGASQASSAIGQMAESAQVQIDDLNQIAEAMQQTSQSIAEAAMTTREASQQAAAAARLVETAISAWRPRGRPRRRERQGFRGRRRACRPARRECRAVRPGDPGVRSNRSRRTLRAA